MMFWIAFDIVLGALPVAGDVLDALFQSNTRNMALIVKHRDKTRPPRSVPAIVGLMLAVVFTLAGISVAVYGAVFFAAIAATRE